MTDLTLRLSLNIIWSNETNFLLQLLLTDRQVESISKASANNSSVNIKLPKPQLTKNSIW